MAPTLNWVSVAITVIVVASFNRKTLLYYFRNVTGPLKQFIDVLTNCKKAKFELSRDNELSTEVKNCWSLRVFKALIKIREQRYIFTSHQIVSELRLVRDDKFLKKRPFNNTCSNKFPIKLLNISKAFKNNKFPKRNF